jgi:hypothetical protein
VESRLTPIMAKSKILAAISIVVALSLAAFLAYRHWHSRDLMSERERLLALMPEDASAVLYVDAAQLRSSPFLIELLQLAPKVVPDNDYAQFLKETGFHYETDLDQMALAINRQSKNSSVFAAVQGKFDRKKIEAFASQYGSLKTADGKTLFAVPLNGSNRKAYFTFLSDDRVAWANDSSYFFQKPHGNWSHDWRDRFLRVAGTPLFAVLRQDSGTAEMLAAQAPGGFQSPQLATLLAQLRWISISAKPEGDSLRVVADGECPTENTERQLKEMLSGLVVLAQVGLNDPKTRKRLDPAVLEGYLELLQSADVQQLDRGSSRSVRLMLAISPKLLEAAKGAASGADPAGN